MRFKSSSVGAIRKHVESITIAHAEKIVIMSMN